MIRSIVRTFRWPVLLVLLLPLLPARPMPVSQDGDYLTWTLKQAETVGKSTRKDGRIGGFFDGRVLSTERSYNFKLRATWFTPEVIRASARFAQIRNRWNNEKTSSIVSDAESMGNTVFLVEIDPREGSGVIPLDWEAYLQVKGQREKAISDNAITGGKAPSLRDNLVFSGVVQRDYAYDRFWVVFPLIGSEKQPILPDSAGEIELLVRIYDKLGSASWPIPESVRQRIKTLMK